jgi:hypothetical protein
MRAMDIAIPISATMSITVLLDVHRQSRVRLDDGVFLVAGSMRAVDAGAGFADGIVSRWYWDWMVMGVNVERGKKEGVNTYWSPETSPARPMGPSVPTC